jgi:uncharacterized protein YbaR (Trm112 family)
MSASARSVLRSPSTDTVGQRHGRRGWAPQPASAARVELDSLPGRDRRRCRNPGGAPVALDPKLLEILACPEDKGPLLYFVDEDTLYNPRLKRRYRILDGDIPDLLIDDAETVDDAEHTRLMNKAETDGIEPNFAQ